MKTSFRSLVAVVLFASVSSRIAVAAELQPRYADVSDLQESIKSDARFSIETFSHGQGAIAIVQFDFTSGVPSSMLTVYAKGQDDWFTALELGPCVGDRYVAKQSGDRVDVRLASTKKRVLRLSIEKLGAEPQRPRK